jgi:hypothetical protein
VGKTQTRERGGALLRFSTNQPKLSCGIVLHARTLDGCILRQAGEGMVHQHGTATPETCLTVLAPYRADGVVAVACLLTWSWCADLGARAGRPGVLGPALSLHATHGGTATNDRIEAPQVAGRWRGAGAPRPLALPPRGGPPAPCSGAGSL